jgi:phage baseplate assembly protein W
MTGPRLDPEREVRDPEREPRGLAYPFRIDPMGGGVAWAEGREKLRDNLMHLLQTNPGERAMVRTYGGGLRDLVQDPNDDVLRALAQHRIGRAIADAEPRIELQVVSVDADRTDAARATLVASIAYRVRRTHQADLATLNLRVGG